MLQEEDWVGRSVLAMAVRSGSKGVVEEVLRCLKEHVSKKKVSCHQLPIAGTMKPHTTVPRVESSPSDQEASKALMLVSYRRGCDVLSQCHRKNICCSIEREEIDVIGANDQHCPQANFKGDLNMFSSLIPQRVLISVNCTPEKI